MTACVPRERKLLKDTIVSFRTSRVGRPTRRVSAGTGQGGGRVEGATRERVSRRTRNPADFGDVTRCGKLRMTEELWASFTAVGYPCAGIPTGIPSDQGQQFKSSEWRSHPR